MREQDRRRISEQDVLELGDRAAVSLWAESFTPQVVIARRMNPYRDQRADPHPRWQPHNRWRWVKTAST